MSIVVANNRILLANNRVLNIERFTFKSVQPAVLNQVTITYKIDTGKSVYIDWGNGSVVLLTANSADQTITSAYVTANTTYTITFFGSVEFVRKFHIYSEVTVSYLDLNNLSRKLTGLTYLYLYNVGTTLTGSISSLPTGLTYLYLNNVGTVTNFFQATTESGGIGTTRASPNQNATCDGSLKVLIGAKTLYIPLYSAVTLT